MLFWISLILLACIAAFLEVVHQGLQGPLCDEHQQPIHPSRQSFGRCLPVVTPAAGAWGEDSAGISSLPNIGPTP